MKTLAEVVIDLRALIEPSAVAPAYMHGKLASVVREDIAAIDAALTVLRELEWYDWNSGRRACPTCGGTRNTAVSELGYHAPDCRLAALIGAKRECGVIMRPRTPG